MDNKDRKIIKFLKENSRYSIREISKKTKIRPSTVHQRIKRLKEEGYIEKFTIKLDNEKTGEDFIVIMFVKTKPSVKIDDRVFQSEHIKEVFGVTGEYDLMIKMKFGNVKEFNDFLIDFRKEQKIETTHTMVVTANIKEEI